MQKAFEFLKNKGYGEEDIDDFLREKGYDDQFSLIVRRYFTAQIGPVTDKVWNWMVKFVTVSAILNKDFDPGSINDCIQHSETGSLVSEVTSDTFLTKKYSSTDLRKYAIEFDAILKERELAMATLYPGGDYSSNQAIGALSQATIVAAVAIYDHTKVDGFTVEQFKNLLKSTIAGTEHYYYVTREIFRALPNEVAIRKGNEQSRNTEIIPGAQYTTKFISIPGEYAANVQHDHEMNQEKVNSIKDLLDDWS